MTADCYLMALYYGFGRADARTEVETPVPPLAFAEWYAAQYDDVAAGRSSHCPSVQDGWDRFRRSI